MAGLTVSDISVSESAGYAAFVVLNEATDETVTVEYRTVSGSATSGSDYTPISGTLTFAPWETGKVVTVAIMDDAIAELDETFGIELSNAVNATLDASQAVATILSNDHAPVIQNLTASQGAANYWTFSGTVSDTDDDPTGWTVTFGGILESYGYTATVESDGTFSLTAEFPELTSGTATAQTTDSSGLDSNLATLYVDA